MDEKREPGTDPARPNQRFARPAREGLRVAYYGSRGRRYLKDAGEWVEWTTYWARRQRDGDVVVEDPPSPAKPKARKKPTTNAED